MIAYPHIPLGGLCRAGLLALAFVAFSATPAGAEERTQPPEPRDEAGIPPLEEFEHQLHVQEGELEERIENFSRAWEKEQQRFFRETEAFREEGEKALEEFMEHARRVMDEHEATIDQRLREFRESAEALGQEWLERYREWEEGLDRAEKEDLEGPEPKEETEVHVVHTEHRPAREILAELESIPDPDMARVVGDHTIVFHGSRKTLEMLDHAIRELDRPAPLPGNLLLSFYVVAAGDLWEGGKPLPDRFDALRPDFAALAPESEPVLLDAVTYRTRADEGLMFMSHLPDSPSGAPQRYHIQIKEIVGASTDGALRLNGLNFETQLYAEDGSRDVQFRVSPELQPGTPALLGSGSLRGTGEILVLVGEVAPDS